MRFRKYLTVLLSAAMAVSVCSNDSFAAWLSEETESAEKTEDVIPVKSQSGQDAEAVCDMYPLYLDSLENLYDMPVYFVNGAKDLPFVNLSDWKSIMNAVYHDYIGDEGYDMSMETDGHLAQLTRENRYSMLVDFQEGTIAFDDYDAFIHKSGDTNLLDSVSTDLQNEEGKDLLVKRVDKGSFDRYGKEVELNLADYKIPMYWSEDEGLYLIPLQTMGDFLISLSTGLNTFFNQTAVYITGFGSLIQNDEVTDLGQSFYNAPYSDMSDDLAWYSYCELCLSLDNLYGLKEEHGISSFDELFTETGYKDRLSSTDPEVADGALFDFIQYYLDDLHSGFKQVSYRTADVKSDLNSGLSMRRTGEDEERFFSARAAADHEIHTYEEVGNTAYITFDEFDLRHTADEYYGGEVEVPDLPDEVPTDTVALILYAHEQITREDSPIENVVIDLSNNGGGAVDAACVAASWFLGEAGMSLKSSFTGALSTGLYQVDANLDGEFDEKDSVADKNLFCIISPVSFSCGNTVPSILKASHKVTLIGQASGGGSCIVLPMSTAYGSCFQISSPLNMSVVKNGSYYNIDTGVEPDMYIAKPENFYDRETLTEKINSLY